MSEKAVSLLLRVDSSHLRNRRACSGRTSKHSRHCRLLGPAVNCTPSQDRCSIRACRSVHKDLGLVGPELPRGASCKEDCRSACAWLVHTSWLLVPACVMLPLSQGTRSCKLRWSRHRREDCSLEHRTRGSCTKIYTYSEYAVTIPCHAMRHAFILANVPLKKYTGRDNPANTFQLRLANVAVQEQAITSSFANKAYAKVMTRHNAL